MKKLLKTLSIFLSVILLFSCATEIDAHHETEEDEEKVIVNENAEADSPMDMTSDAEITEAIPGEVKTEGDTASSGSASPREDDEEESFNENEETGSPLNAPQENTEDDITSPDSTPLTEDKAEESAVEPVSETIASEDRSNAKEEETIFFDERTTPIEWDGGSGTISSFSYAFGVKNMNDLIQSDIPFITIYFMRGMYDASVDWKTPQFVTLGNLQNVINAFYEEYIAEGITFDYGRRPENVEELLSVEESGDERALFSYAYGFSVIRELLSQEIDIEIIPFMAGMLDSLYSESSPLTDEEISEAYNRYIIYLNEEYYRAQAEKAEENREKAEAFLLLNSREEGVTVLDNGVQLLILDQDDVTGEKPTQYATVILDYNEYVLDYETGELELTDADWGAEISVINLSPGFQTAVTNMHTGEAVRAFIPPELSSMADGDGDEIEPNSLFVYDIALHKIL